MKSLVFFAAIVFLFGACAPEKVINKKLNGEWILQTIDGQALDPNFSETVNFFEDGKEGDITFRIVNNGQTTSSSGTYALLKSSNLTVAIPNGNAVGYPYDTEVFDINESSKTDLKLTKQSDGKVYVFKKK